MGFFFLLSILKYWVFYSESREKKKKRREKRKREREEKERGRKEEEGTQEDVGVPSPWMNMKMILMMSLMTR